MDPVIQNARQVMDEDAARRSYAFNRLVFQVMLAALAIGTATLILAGLAMGE